MPRLVDYSSRFAFFQMAAFAIVLEEGVDRLSRHRIAAALGTSLSTVRRLLNAEADLRNLALVEVGVRRRRRLGARMPDEPGAHAVALLGRLVPTTDDHIAEELVWWRLSVTAPSAAAAALDVESPEGRLHEQFAFASQGFAPEEWAHTPPDGVLALTPHERAERAATDPVAITRVENRQRLENTVLAALELLDRASADELRRTTAIVEGLNISVCLGHLTPPEAFACLEGHVRGLQASSPSSAIRCA